MSLKNLGVRNTWLAFVAVVALVFGLISTVSVAQADPAVDSSTEQQVDETEEVVDEGSATAEANEAEAQDDVEVEETVDEIEVAEEDLSSESADSELFDSLTESNYSLGQDRATTRNVNNDPRYTCGLSIGILFDASGSTTMHQQSLIQATRNVAQTLRNTGSSLGIHTFNGASPANPNLGNFAPVLLDDAGYAQAENYINRLYQAWQYEVNGSNMAAGFRGMQNAGYDVVIMISDGLVFKADRTRYPNVTWATDEDLQNTLNAVDALKAQGTSVMSIYVANREWASVQDRIINSNPPAGVTSKDSTAWFPTTFQPLPGTSWDLPTGTKAGSKFRIYFNDQIRLINANSSYRLTGNYYEVTRTANGNTYYLAWARLKFDGQAFMASFSDYQESVTAYDAVAEALENMVSGCSGTVTIHKEIVDSSGKVTTDSPEGFTFTASRALNGDQTVSNLSRTTDGWGELSYKYPVTTGAASITITENPTRNGETFNMVNQTVGGVNTVARCTATDSKGNSLRVSYGSGSGIVVTSTANLNRFQITGLGRDDRVSCVIQNQKRAATFQVAKSAVAGSEPLITGENRQQLTTRYLVSVTNSSNSAGVPTTISEIPRVPAGTTITAVQARRTSSGTQLLNSNANFRAGSSNTWLLDASNAQFNEIPARGSAVFEVVVTYLVSNASSLTENQITCFSNNSNRGFFNTVQVLPGSSAASPTTPATGTACISGYRNQEMFQMTKTAETTDRLVINGEQGQLLTARYLLTVNNIGDVAAAPQQILEQPQAPNGTRVTRVQGRVTGSGNQIIRRTTDFTWDSSEQAWVLSNGSGSVFRDVAQNASASMYVYVTFEVTDPSRLTYQYLNCSEGSNWRGFYNTASVVPGDNSSNTDIPSSDNACMSGIKPNLSIQTFANDEDANTAADAAALMPTANSYESTFVITNMDTTPITEINLYDYKLINENNDRGDRVWLSSVTCDRTITRSYSNGVLTLQLSRNPLLQYQPITCTWIATGDQVPGPAESYGHDVVALANYSIPSYQTVNASSALVEASDPAWVVKFPAAIGDLPMSGGAGVNAYFYIGFLLLTFGGFTMVRRRKI